MSFQSSYGGSSTYSTINVLDASTSTSVPITNDAGTVTIDGNLSTNFALLSSTPYFTVASIVPAGYTSSMTLSSPGIYLLNVTFTTTSNTTLTANYMDTWTVYIGGDSFTNSTSQTIYNSVCPRYTVDYPTTVQEPQNVTLNTGYFGSNFNQLLTLIPQYTSSPNEIVFCNVSDSLTIYNLNVYVTRLC